MKKDFDYNADLKKRLQDLKKIEGFPIGEDEDILALSNPPYYTACPNPYINEFIEKYGNPYNEETDDYYREPFVGDISEGKRDPMYMMHTYHTKVPHKAIIKFLEHYTNEDDIVLDAYSGSGMTGVAAQILKRNSILLDLAPAATFISHNNNQNLSNNEIAYELKKIINKSIEDFLDIFKLPNGDIINYIIWSEVFTCPYCSHEIDFWNGFVNLKDESFGKYIKCPSCNAENISKSNLNRPNKIPKYIPTYVSILKGKSKIKRKLTTDEQEYLLDLEKSIKIPYKFPQQEIPDGHNLNQPKKSHGFSKISDFYFNTSLLIISKMWDLATKSSNPNFARFFITSIVGMRCTKRMPYRPGGLSAGSINNLSIPSLIQQYNPLLVAERKLEKNFIKAIASIKSEHHNLISTQSATDLSNIFDNSIDYIFTDPPFGSNIMYSDLNFLWEGWLNVFTNTSDETIVNKIQNKDLYDYTKLLSNTFKEYYRVLKPNRWITVEFNNSQSSIWNSIRSAMLQSGFIIAQISVLDKKLGSFKQVSSSSSVEKDLVISAYKPSILLESALVRSAGKDYEVFFIKDFLSKQPKKPIIERTEKMLYSKLISYYLNHNYQVSYDSKTFYSLLRNNFVEEDGYWFNAGQINSYIEYKKKMKFEGIDEIKQGAMMMFVTDEKSALVWLHNFINEPKSFSNIHTAFTQLANIQGDEVPDLKDLLEQNFIAEKDLYRRPQTEPEHNSVIEKREKQLMRQFESLFIQAQTEKKKIKSIRKEAVQLGFETCYKEKRFRDILTLANKLDKKILEENAELKEFVDAAEIMVSGLS
ncbi:MAG: hypothetical protein KAX05_04545 [Bacteroidales bacterium]|nr:hypothetical protein [Bacteroidales bacterium]